MAIVNMLLWTSPWLCHWCSRDRRGFGTCATVRVFSGKFASGWPACDLHAPLAAERALRPLVRRDGWIGDDYEVVAREVVVDKDDGSPQLGRTLWVARAKVQIPDPALHG